jgi:hypothetical protein
VHLREQHANFRMGAGQRLQRQGSVKNAAMSAGSRKGRRRWLEGSQDDSHADADAGAGSDLIPASRGECNTGHIVRMKRAEAWSKFLAYEGCCQVRSCRRTCAVMESNCADNAAGGRLFIKPQQCFSWHQPHVVRSAATA